MLTHINNHTSSNEISLYPINLVGSHLLTKLKEIKNLIWIEPNVDMDISDNENKYKLLNEYTEIFKNNLPFVISNNNYQNFIDKELIDKIRLVNERNKTLVIMGNMNNINVDMDININKYDSIGSNEWYSYYLNKLNHSGDECDIIFPDMFCYLNLMNEEEYNEIYNKLYNTSKIDKFYLNSQIWNNFKIENNIKIKKIFLRDNDKLNFMSTSFEMFEYVDVYDFNAIQIGYILGYTDFILVGFDKEKYDTMKNIISSISPELIIKSV